MLVVVGLFGVRWNKYTAFPSTGLRSVYYSLLERSLYLSLYFSVVFSAFLYQSGFFSIFRHFAVGFCAVCLSVSSFYGTHFATFAYVFLRFSVYVCTFIFLTAVFLCISIFSLFCTLLFF